MSAIQRIIKSTSDIRNYKSITLRNKLQCLLVSDSKADKSAAAMNVNVGHLQDPFERPGLAHFLEHMLFMGTEKYPNQSEYSEYLAKNGGNSNAYTSSMETNYYFGCSNASIEGALDRFSQFFSKPLFSQSCIEKEMNAVHSEHQKNLMQDNWRLVQLFRSSALPGNEFGKFGTGDLSTLNHPTIRDDLINFYKKYYSANLMRLVIVSNQEIQAMEGWVEKLFSDIPNSDFAKPSFSSLPFTQENTGTLWKIVPIKDIHQLSLKFILPDMRVHYKNSPSSYISHLLGHEGKNSLLSILISKGLAVELSAGGQNEMNSWSLMNIEIQLTNKGIENYETVLQIVFAYIAMLKKQGVNRWVFDEVKLLNQLNFNNKDNEHPQGYAVSLASRMQSYPIEEVLILPYLNENFEEALIQQTLNALTVENVRISVISKSFESECGLVEPIYKTKYTFSKIDKRLQDILLDNKLSEGFSLIERNQFLPKSMEIFAKDFDALPKVPQLIRNEKDSTVWFKQDNEFKKPKALLKSKISFPAFSGSTKSKVLFALWNNLLKEQMREISYMAEMAYLGTELSPADCSLEVVVGGFNDSLAPFAKQLFSMIANFECTDKVLFDIQYEKLMRGYQNIQKAQPYQLLVNYSTPFLSTRGINPDELLPTLQSVTFEEFLQFQKNFMNKLRFEWLFQGNLTSEGVLKFAVEAEEILKEAKKVKILTLDEIPSARAIQLPSKTVFWEKLLDAHETNSAIFLNFQYDHESLTTEIKLDILNQIIKTPFFERLRTDEQLGYVVMSSLNITRGVMGFVFMVQSDVKPPQFFAKRIDAFLADFKTKIEALSNEEFAQYKASIISNLKQKNQSVFEETAKNWAEIANNTLIFDRKAKKLELIEKITIQEIQQLYTELFFGLKKRLEVHFVSQVHAAENEVLKAERLKTEDIEQITSITSFRNSSALYPDYYSKL